MLLFECEGNFTEEHFNKGVNCFDRANMPFLKCKSSSIVAGWAVGAMVRTLIHFNLNRTFISICVDFMVKFSRNIRPKYCVRDEAADGKKVRKESCRHYFLSDFPRVANSNNYSVKARFKDDTLLIRTTHYCQQFALSLGR